LLLSPTRTFAPVMKILLEEHFDAIHGLIHCSGGGQTKCMKYVPENVHIIKDNLFEPPVIFQLIQSASKSDDREMYQVFNMGTRLEIYTNEKNADEIISVSKDLGVDARVIGRVEASNTRSLTIQTPNGSLDY
jgi:phosphoribosylformylglycinamidine cyclo-ligase